MSTKCEIDEDQPAEGIFMPFFPRRFGHKRKGLWGWFNTPLCEECWDEISRGGR